MIHLQIRQQRRAGFTLALDLTLPSGSFTALAGPSGAGKTTVLRLLAGLERPDSGRIVVDDAVWCARGRWLPPQRRAVGMVFQDYALFPHLTVRENVAFGAGNDRQLVDELLEISGLGPLAARRPASLSGGQRQRVALARALARRPKLLLLDEPLSALDPAMRAELQNELAQLHRRFALTTVMVSHDTAEIFRLADRVIRLEDGAIAADGTPAAVFLDPPRNGRFTVSARVLAIRPADTVWKLTVQIGADLVDILVSERDAAGMAVGQTLALSAGALVPLPLAAKETGRARPAG